MDKVIEQVGVEFNIGATRANDCKCSLGYDYGQGYNKMNACEEHEGKQIRIKFVRNCEGWW